jgi:hypothetical protein
MNNGGSLATKSRSNNLRSQSLQADHLRHGNTT